VIEGPEGCHSRSAYGEPCQFERRHVDEQQTALARVVTLGAQGQLVVDAEVRVEESVGGQAHHNIGGLDALPEDWVPSITTGDVAVVEELDPAPTQITHVGAEGLQMPVIRARIAYEDPDGGRLHERSFARLEIWLPPSVGR